MTKQRTPYGPRRLWPGETAAGFEAPVSELDRPFDKAQDRLRQRIAALEAAARAVCGPHEYLGLLLNDIYELGRLVGEEGE